LVQLASVAIFQYKRQQKKSPKLQTTIEILPFPKSLAYPK
jgi:hypothetical protein